VADADIDDAAQWLRRLASDADLRGKMGAIAAAEIAAKLSPQTFAATVAGLLSQGERKREAAGRH
jgi:glycosyltransferase involved in cell wall biosynthesis